QRLGLGDASTPSSSSAWVSFSSTQTWLRGQRSKGGCQARWPCGADAVLGGTSLTLLVAGREQRGRCGRQRFPQTGAWAARRGGGRCTRTRWRRGARPGTARSGSRVGEQGSSPDHVGRPPPRVRRG